jgi:hypothetical protein
VKYMLMMHYGGEGEPIHLWPPKDVQAHIRFMLDLNKRLSDSGELVDAQGLSGPEQAKIVRASKQGPPAITDGPFPESKELLAGYWVVDVDSEKRAIAIAAEISAAPGIGGKRMSIPVELRQVMSGPHEA